MSTPTIRRPESVHLTPGAWPLEPQALTEEDLLNEATTRSEQIFDDFSSGQYECVICSDEIPADGKIWNCTTCYHVYHHDCMISWSERVVSAGVWPCPTCKSTIYHHQSNQASCWCGGKTHSTLDLIGNTCGNMCSKINKCKRQTCFSACKKPCHPGPCDSVVCATDCEKTHTIVTVQPKTTEPARVYQPQTQAVSVPNDPTSSGHRRIPGEPSIDGSDEFGACIFASICIAIPNIPLLIWGSDRAKWWSQPLKYRHFTKHQTANDLRGSVAVQVLNTLYTLFFSLMLACMLYEGITKRFKLRERNRVGRRILTGLLAFAVWFLTTFGVIIVLNEAPSVAWRNQFHDACKGFDTVVHLDRQDCQWVEEERCEGLPSNSLALLQRIRLDTLHPSMPLLGNFTLTSIPQNTTHFPPSTLFSSYHRLSGYLFSSPGNLSLDYDLTNHAYRVLSSSSSPNTLISNGTWTPTSPSSPHSIFPSLSLSIPNLHLFSTNCHYQPFTNIYSTLTQSSHETSQQPRRAWSKKREANLVMRTMTPTGGPAGMDACLNMGLEDENGIVEAGEEGESERAEKRVEMLVPLGLLAVLRKEMEAQGRFREACSFP